MAAGFVLYDSIDADRIAETVREYGICIIPGAFSSYVDKLNEEYKWALSGQDKDISLDEYDHKATVARFMKNDRILSNLPTVQSIFFSEIALRSTEKYFRRRDMDFNCEFILNENQGIPDRVDYSFFSMHFDKLHSFKWYIYLNDIDEGCGPFEVVPRSHSVNMKLRMRMVERGLGGTAAFKTEVYDNLVDFHPEQVFPCVGPKGTALIFDTDISHRAGWVREGKFRRIVRSHSFSRAYAELVYNHKSVDQIGWGEFLSHF